MSIRSIARLIVQPLRQIMRHYQMMRLRHRHSAEMQKRLKADSPEYREYLKTQLVRTLYKRDAALPERARRFIGYISSHIDLPQCNILCVGCRNTAEIDHFRALGAGSVIGIDIYSENKDILVMDMHEMTFEDGRFDLVYSSHSFEHALEPEKVVLHIRRVLRPGGHVAIEVPIQYRTREADIQDYHSMENLLKLFGASEADAVWSEQVDPGKEWGNPENTVLRVLFRIDPHDSEVSITS